MTVAFEAPQERIRRRDELSTSSATYAIGSAPSRGASRLGLRGLKRRRVLENNPVWAQIEPLVRWLGVRVPRHR